MGEMNDPNKWLVISLFVSSSSFLLLPQSSFLFFFFLPMQHLHSLQQWSLTHKHHTKIQHAEHGPQFQWRFWVLSHCCKWFFARVRRLGGVVPKEQQPRAKAPIDSTASPCHQGSFPRGGKERGLSKMTFDLIPLRMASKGVTEGGANFVTRPSGRD